MVASPGSTPLNTYKKRFEVEYSNRLREIPINELVEIIDFETSNTINDLANNKEDFMKTLLPNQEDVKYNTSVYSDEIEDFIINSTVLDIIKKSRELGDHASAEKVRVIRSARAVIYCAGLNTGE